MVKYAITLLVGIIAGYLLFDWQNKGNIDRVVTKTEYKIDTVFTHSTDTIHIPPTEIKTTFLRDTIFAEPYEAKINAFKTSKPFLYGNTTVSGEVLGELLKMSIINDFKIPTITNTITNTTTITKKPSGLFLTAGVNQQLTPSVGAIFIKNRYLVGLNTNGFQVGYKIGR